VLCPVDATDNDSWSGVSLDCTKQLQWSVTVLGNGVWGTQLVTTLNLLEGRDRGSKGMNVVVRSWEWSRRTFGGDVAVVVRTVNCGVGPPLQRGGECKGLERTF
jgi:hypothetical protein